MDANNLPKTAHNTNLQNRLLVLPLGFDAALVERIKGIFNSGYQGSRSYELTGAETSDTIDILLVNHDNPMSVHKKDMLLRTRCPHAVVVIVSQGPLVTAPEYHIRGMLTASRLLSILDKLPVYTQSQLAAKHDGNTANVADLTATKPVSKESYFTPKPLTDVGQALPIKESVPVNAAVVGRLNIPPSDTQNLTGNTNTPFQPGTPAFDFKALVKEPMPDLQSVVAPAQENDIPLKINEVSVASMATSSQTEGYRALVVDDSLAIQMSIKLKLQGIEQITVIDFADDGESALVKAEAMQYDLIFLDVMMPGIDGYETCTRLRKKMEYKKTPIIMVSGKTSPLDEVKGVMAGCTTYLTKPVEDQSFHKLSLRVLNWLADRKTTATTK